MAVVATALAVHLTANQLRLDVGGDARTYGWLPWWVTLLGVAGAGGLLAWQFRRGAPVAACERGVLAYVALPVTLVSATARIAPVTTVFNGYDGVHGIVHADLLGRGLFPWRDLRLPEGLFDDALRSLVGMHLFEDTLWGARAATTVLWVPLLWAGIALVAVPFARRTWLPLVLVALVLAAVAQRVDPSTRWVGLGYLLALLGLALERRGRGWSVGLAVALVPYVVLVPEAWLLAMAVVVVLVGADLTQAAAGGSWARSTVPSRWFLATVVVLLGAWFLFLALQDALGPFLRSYAVTFPGRPALAAAPWGSAPVLWRLLFACAAAVVVVTVVVVGLRLARDRRVMPLEWLLLAMALFVGLQAESALVRFDREHVLEVLTVVAPLVTAWFARGVCWGEGRFVEAWEETTTLDTRRMPTTLLSVTAAVVLALGLLVAVGGAPARTELVDGRAARVPRIGAEEPGGVDEALVRDLGRTLDVLLRPGDTVFDLTDSPGYVSYLLGRTPSTPYASAGDVVTDADQRDLVFRLRIDPPAAVLLDSASTGRSGTDGVTTAVRLHRVSQYLLDGWTPVVRTRGVLVLLRDDLAARAQRLPAGLGTPAMSVAAGPPCDWGAAPTFLDTPVRSRTSITVGAERVPAVALVASGTIDPSVAGRPGARLVVTLDGRVVRRVPIVDVPRDPEFAALRPGRTFALSLLLRRTGALGLYVDPGDGVAHALVLTGEALANPVTSDRRPDVAYAADPRGSLGVLRVRPVVLRSFVVPALDWGRFRAVTLVGSAPLGVSSLTLTGRPFSGSPDDVITLNTPASTGGSVTVRVGSCPQWHASPGRRVYLVQDGLTPVRQLVFSPTIVE